MESRNMRAWSAELARAAAEIHAISPANIDLSSLQLHMRDGIRRNLDDWRDNVQGNALASDMHSALEKSVDSIEFPPPVLIHGDYWPGNTIWQRGKITGIVDWGTAALGDPRIDIAECRMVNVFNASIDAAERFTEDYERLSGRALADIWFFDLYRCVWAVLETEHYLEGVHDLGQTHLKLSDVGPRLRTFVLQALDQARRA
jgi:aminoglycoside phosphotransferase (APT) family kinase protein